MNRIAGLGAGALLLAAVWAGAALAGDAPLSEVPGETSVRLPLGSESYVLHGLLSPYLSLGSSTALGAPWNAALPPGLGRDADGLDDLRLGAGMALPLSERAQEFGFRVGLALVVMLMIFATFNDIKGIFFPGSS